MDMDFDLLAAARDLIAADSVSANGNLRAVEVLEGVAKRLGLETYRQEATALGAPQANLIVHPKGAPPRDGGLLLVTHTDTVGPGPLDLWTKTNPWVLEQEGDTLYGLGVADVKLDSLAKLQALAHAPPSAHGKVAFLGTFAEEVGCLGARHFVNDPPFRPAWVSCGEPSELAIIDAHKGYLVAHLLLDDPAPTPAPDQRLRITVTGKAAHSSTPHLGVNAIDAAIAFCQAHGLRIHLAEGGDLANKVPARCMVEVDAAPGVEEAARAKGYGVEPVGGARPSMARALDLGRQVGARLWEIVQASGPAQNPRFDPATPVFNNGVVSTEGSRLELMFDARLLPGHDPIAIFEAIEAEGAQMAAAQGLLLQVERNRSNFAMELREDSPLRRAAMEASRSLHLDPRPQAKPTNTEGGVFVSAGMDAIVFGPGRSTGNAHTANEWQSLSQIEKAARWYRALIHNLCG
jgi:acetylornithine deacetylase/succinyl-diaminopimelate desuccinylase-like protein